MFSLLLLAAGCNQDPIFDYISGETAPTTAKIRGSPTKIVSLKTGAGEEAVEKLYLANGRLWEYAPAAPGSSWERVSAPEGDVRDVASTSDGVLYALVIDNAASKVWQRQDDGTWALVAPFAGYGFTQTIFGAGDILFATVAQKIGDANYRICYKNKSGPLGILTDPTGAILNGARLTGAGKVGSDYYLAGREKGIYKVSVAGVPGEEDYKVTAALMDATPTDVEGLLQAKFLAPERDVIIGISKGGALLYIDASGITKETTSLGGTYSGAIAMLDIPEPHEDGFDKLLLLGNQNSSYYNHGYTELRFNSTGKTPDTKTQTPGQSQPSSIMVSNKSQRQYESSLKRYPVTALWVLPKSEQDPQVIFAVTSNQGLYSYRSRSGEWQWNHE
jgi:hypothetical protein